MSVFYDVTSNGQYTDIPGVRWVSAIYGNEGPNADASPDNPDLRDDAVIRAVFGTHRSDIMNNYEPHHPGTTRQLNYDPNLGDTYAEWSSLMDPYAAHIKELGVIDGTDDKNSVVYLAGTYDASDYPLGTYRLPLLMLTDRPKIFQGPGNSLYEEWKTRQDEVLDTPVPDAGNSTWLQILSARDGKVWYPGGYQINPWHEADRDDWAIQMCVNLQNYCDAKGLPAVPMLWHRVLNSPGGLASVPRNSFVEAWIDRMHQEDIIWGVWNVSTSFPEDPGFEYVIRGKTTPRQTMKTYRAGQTMLSTPGATSPRITRENGRIAWVFPEAEDRELTFSAVAPGVFPQETGVIVARIEWYTSNNNGRVRWEGAVERLAGGTDASQDNFDSWWNMQGYPQETPNRVTVTNIYMSSNGVQQGDLFRVKIRRAGTNSDTYYNDIHDADVRVLRVTIL